MIGVFPVLYLVWKMVKRTKIYRAEEIDVFKGVKEVEEDQQSYVPKGPR
jgi:amino acid transporter